MYIRTDHAWYILDTPSLNFAPFWIEFSIRERIFYELITEAQEDRALTYEEFLDHLVEQDDTDRPITEADLQSYSVVGALCSSRYAQILILLQREYLRDAFDELQRECQEGHSRICARLLNVPAVKMLVQPPHEPSPSVSPEPSGSTAREPSVEAERSLSPSVPLERPGFASRVAPEGTVVTPRVYDLCKELYPLNEFDVVGTSDQKRVKLSKRERRRHPVHKGNPQEIVWGEESRTVAGHYESVLIDGVQYDVGDTVMVEPGEDDNKARVQNVTIESSNPTAESKWSVQRLLSIVNADIVPLLGSLRSVICTKSSIRGATRWRMCSTIRTAPRSFSRRLPIHMGSSYSTSAWTSTSTRYTERSTFMFWNRLRTSRSSRRRTMSTSLGMSFCHCIVLVLKYDCRVCWDPLNATFFDRTPEEEERARARCDDGRPCVSCGMSLLQGDDDEWTISHGALVHGGVTYHVDDFVYIRPELPETDVYIIAQIVAVRRSKNLEKIYHAVDLRLYQRCDLVIRAETKAEFGLREMDEVSRLTHTLVVLDLISSIATPLPQ